MSAGKGTGGKDPAAVPEPAQEPDLGPEAAASLLRALRNTAVSVVYQDTNLRVVWARNVPPSWSIGSLVGQNDDDFLPAHAAKMVRESKLAVLAGSGPQHLEIHVPPAHRQSDKWFNLWVDADKGPDGEIRGIVTTAVEITDQKQREQTLRVLLREVSHRSRNLLAIIQSIATQTGRHAPTVDAFLKRFRGRLQSLAASQDLVTSSNWRGADLGDLAYGQAARYTDKPHDALRLDGDGPWLNPNAALHVGLALHELIANSVSYGAMSRPGGYATLRSLIQGNRHGDTTLLLVWQENTGSGPPEKEFGSVALERIVPAALNGSAELNMDGDMLEYRLTIPPGNFEAP
jgi:two-component sensor histidine kinase